MYIRVYMYMYTYMQLAFTEVGRRIRIPEEATQIVTYTATHNATHTATHNATHTATHTATQRPHSHRGKQQRP